MSILAEQQDAISNGRPCRSAGAPARAIAPGSAAEESLIKDHLPLVKTVVGRLAIGLPPHVDLDDLYSAGLVGLLHAVRNFDPAAGSSFESYARVRIRGSALDELRRLDWVPRSIHEKARKVQVAMQELEQRRGAPPTSSEMAKALGLNLPQYEALLEEIRPAVFVCLDSPGGSDEADDQNRYDQIPDESQPDPVDRAAHREMSDLVAARLQELPEIQRKVLAFYYFEDMRLREIAQVFGLTESRICQIHSEALLAVRSLLEQRGAPAGLSGSTQVP